MEEREMNGTEKQIAWAQDILASVDGLLENVKLASEAGMFAGERDAMVATADKISGMIDSIRGDAKKVIDSRDQLTAEYTWKVFVKLMDVDHGIKFDVHWGVVNAEGNSRR
ncbi:MAG: hypothetical protein ACLFUM_11985 [Spirochaetaceae bacterium]